MVEPSALVLAGGVFDWAGAAQGHEGRLVAEAVVVVAGGYEQDGRAVRADAGESEQLRVVGLDERRDPAGERGGLGM